MSLVLHHKDEAGYRPLDLNQLTDEQAIEIGTKVHALVLPMLRLQDSLVVSLRLERAVSWIEPKLITFRDVADKPLESWRSHPFMTPRIYHELRDAVRPFGVRLPAWEMLP